MKRFIVDKGPFLRSVDERENSTSKMMLNVLIALIPTTLFGWVLFGILPVVMGGYDVVYNSKFIALIRPLFNVLFGAFCSMTLEGLYFFLFKKVRGFKNVLTEVINSFAVIPGVILALILPTTIPLYVILFGCIMANIIFKMLFGGLGHNIFNPALIGYALCVFAFSSSTKSINSCLETQGQMIANVLNNINGFNVISSATPLTYLKSLASNVGSFSVSYQEACGNFGGLLNCFIGFKNGNLGEVSGLCCLIGLIYLLITKVINWRVPVFYLGSVFVVTLIISLVCHIDGLWFPVFNLCTGGLLFGAIFMATEPVTTPKNPMGKIIFGLACGILTCLFRLVGKFPEGVATAILFMCLFTPIIDRFCACNKLSDKKGLIKYLILFIFFGLIAFYTIYKCSNIVTDLSVSNIMEVL